jgi:hypothetical protein
VNFCEKVFLSKKICCKVFHAWGLAAYSLPENVNGIGIATCIYYKWGVKDQNRSLNDSAILHQLRRWRRVWPHHPV